MVHLRFLWSLRPVLDSRAARVACSKTSRTPSLVLAEHSRYLVAPIFLRTSSPCDDCQLCYVAAAKGCAYLVRSYRLLGGLMELLKRLLVVAQVLLAPNKDDGQAWAEV